MAFTEQEIEEAENEAHEVWEAALAAWHARITGRPLDLGSGETVEESVGGTVSHYVESVARRGTERIMYYLRAYAEGKGIDFGPTFESGIYGILSGEVPATTDGH